MRNRSKTEIYLEKIWRTIINLLSGVTFGIYSYAFYEDVVDGYFNIKALLFVIVCITIVWNNTGKEWW